ncbi:LuxR C-terminal-related transcriptional regulator [Flagellatimonas centrodinii]|uniref:helix-turn-helix transcriptional regulator n=1 Tax=Flagellatimonas centrodinii TaxID=2806210 RepID=UPI001FEE9A1C|nr:LuxR C-terminal-related transcriptional regulator [Flagellatimonas centrodinii]ULQ47797.1 LuxR C-terminal-related transcriptional regulator [Flagellatimonas centrodinii]
MRALPPEAVLTLERVDPLLTAIYEGATESPPWRTAMELLRDELKAAHVTLILRPPSSDSTGIMINTGEITRQGVESYESHFFAMDPFVRLNEGDVVTAEELIGHAWLQSAVYQEYLKPLDIRHLLGADIYTREGIECRLRVTRSHDAEPFSDADKALCRYLLPHLKRSIQTHARFDFLECERKLFAGTVNRMLVGMVSYAQDGSIIETSQEARRILAEKDGIWLTGDTLCVDSSQESRELQRMIRQALSGTESVASDENDGPGVVEAMSVSRPSGRSKLGVLVRTIPMGEYSESRQRPAVVVFLRDPESNAAQPSQELVRRLFGLTRMEAQLAMLLADGLTLDEAAEQMNVRRNTARTHLRSIFCKTGVTRQTMLVRLMLNSVLSLG